MSLETLPLLGISTPTFEALIVLLVAASLPIVFFFAVKWWLRPGAEEEESEPSIQIEKKADEKSKAHHGSHTGPTAGH